MCEHYEHLADVADELCVYHGCVAESINHPTACYHMNTGNRFGGDPAVGAWTTYGLGTENQNLPAFVVLPEVAYPQGGPANWSNGFLPAYYQGTHAATYRLPDPRSATATGRVARTTAAQSRPAGRNSTPRDRQRHPQHDDLAARMEAYELAFRMQTQVPDVIDVTREAKETLGRLRDRPDSQLTPSAVAACWPGD